MNHTGKIIGDKCEPAASVIVKLGGVRKLARTLCLNPASITRWQTDLPKGRGGLIPARYHQTLLALARKNAITLTADDLVGNGHAHERV